MQLTATLGLVLTTALWVVGCTDSTFSGEMRPPNRSANLAGKVDDCDPGKDKGCESQGADANDGGDGEGDADVADHADASDTEVDGEPDGGKGDVDGGDSSADGTADVDGGDSSADGTSDVGGSDDNGGKDDIDTDDDDIQCSMKTVQVDPDAPATLAVIGAGNVAFNAKIDAAIAVPMGNGTNPRNDPATADKLCEILGYQNVVSINGTSWRSPGDNTLVLWNGSSWATANGRTHNNWIEGLTCKDPLTTTKQVCEKK